MTTPAPRWKKKRWAAAALVAAPIAGAAIEMVTTGDANATRSFLQRTGLWNHVRDAFARR